MKNTSNVLKGLEEIPTNYELVNELIEQRNINTTLRAPTSVIFRFRQFAFCKIYKQAMNYTIKTNINENWNKMQ